MRRSALLMTLLVAGAMAAACGPSAAPPTNPPAAESPAAETAPAGSASVAIVDFAFEPAQLSVSVGDTITWTNEGQAPHTVRWQDGEPESAELGNGDTYERTFSSAGSFPYVCGIHSDMTGTITVSE